MIALAADDPRYPVRLGDAGPVTDPLWVAGDVRVLARPAVAIVGTRRMSPYGERVARELASELASAGAVVISGLAPGIDCAAHAGALDAEGSSIAVLGEGVSAFLGNARGRRRLLAARLRAAGALVSTYPPVAPAQGWMFAKRNAIIAALGHAVVVVEAPARSGALITATDAGRIGRPLFAVPGPLGSSTSEGANALIAGGRARLCLGAEAVALAIGVTVAAPPSATDALLDALAGGPLDIDALARRTRLERGALGARLVGLILRGEIHDEGDGRYARGRSSAARSAAHP